MDTTSEDWMICAGKTRAEYLEWLRSLTPEQSWEVYCRIMRVAAEFPMPPDVEAKIRERKWQEKLEGRRLFVELARREAERVQQAQIAHAASDSLAWE
jgi:hypothetical protein